MKKTGVLLIHFQSSPHTLPCLDSLQQATADNMVVYVLNAQGEADEHIRNHPVKPVVIDEPHNLGFSGGNNILIKQALADGCSQVILLNNDTIVDSQFLQPLLQSLEDTSVGMVCPKIYFFKGCEFHQDAYKADEFGKVIWYAGGVIDWNHVYGSHWGVDEVDHGQFSTSQETMFATGCCLAIRAEVIQEVGMMDNNYFLYFEDTDWSQRVRKRGYKIVVEPSSVVWHKNAGSSDGPGSDLHLYYQTRNRFLFGMKYAPFRVKFHLLKQYMGYLSNKNSTLKKAATDALLSRFGFQPLL